MTMRAGLAALALALALAPASARAGDRPIDLGGAVTLDIASVVAGDGDARLRVLSNIDLTAEADLAVLIGWNGAKAYAHVLDNRGARPNDAAMTLQGVDNIEVPDAGLRLFEAWVEQDLGKGASLLIGLYDLNSEFYANDAAGVLLAPPFGIGSELAATGPNGPSIFPYSALAARLRLSLGDGGGYVQAAVVNARASTIGDSGGIDMSFRDGVLLIAEVGKSEGRLRGSAGVWRYSRNPEDSVETAPDGAPLRKPAQGAYFVVEGDLLPGEGRQLTAFLRAGLSDPHTTPFTGGFQTGLLLAPAIASRLDSEFSVGVHHAWTSDHFRDAFAAAGGRPASGETAFEVTYADSLTPWLAVQPDLQWIRRPGADLAASDAVVATLRVTASF
ncbi:porin [Novosphingobium hassiacum]|uniref:Porin n=1 Tax=Novosphingobium hassiacum TaxID=173676 RepID=A0A7W5ZUB9_9SPHN|nr:carbohydrate porin [Novosphingobium hassiacum]MBB3859646.1 porin [Novosphingobium hassiacum]